MRDVIHDYMCIFFGDSLEKFGCGTLEEIEVHDCRGVQSHSILLRKFGIVKF